MKRFREGIDENTHFKNRKEWDDSDEELNSDDDNNSDYKQFVDDNNDGASELYSNDDHHDLFHFTETFNFPSLLNDDRQEITIQLKTSISSEAKHTGTHLWNCSVLLTHYLIGQLEKSSGGESDLFETKQRNNEPITILELGCGLGLPSLATCKINPQNRCILTDLYTDDFEKRCRTQCEINGLGKDQYEIIPIDWGNNFLELYNRVGGGDSHKKVDLIVATDCLYDKKLYDAFFSTVYFLKKLFNNPNLPLLLAQYKRNESDNITYQLRRWKLQSKPVQWKEGIDLEKYLKIMGKSNENLEKQFYELFESTQMVIIQ